MHVRQVRAGNRQTDRLGAGRQQQRAIADPAFVAEGDDLLRGIDLGDAGIQPDLDPVLGVELLRS